jgi:hypothetical protein
VKSGQRRYHPPHEWMLGGAVRASAGTDSKRKVLYGQKRAEVAKKLIRAMADEEGAEDDR